MILARLKLWAGAAFGVVLAIFAAVRLIRADAVSDHQRDQKALQDAERVDTLKQVQERRNAIDRMRDDDLHDALSQRVRPRNDD